VPTSSRRRRSRYQRDFQGHALRSRTFPGARGL